MPRKAIHKVFQYVREDAFLKHNSIFFAGSIGVAILNYLYHPILSRMMSIEDFGEVQVLFSLMFLANVVLLVIKMIALNVISNNPNPNEDISRLTTLAYVIYLPFIIALALLSPILSNFFSFASDWGSRWAFAPFALLLLVSIPYTFYSAYLQGKHRFGVVSVANIIVSTGKLLVAICLVLLGLRVIGAISSFFIATLVALLYSRYKSTGFRIHLTPLQHTLESFKKELPYGLLIFVSLGFVTFLYSADVLVVKRLFSPEIAGLYSGLATIARIIFFATASISAVLISSIKKLEPENNKKVLKKAVILVCIIGVTALIVFSLFPQFIVSLLIGKKYLPFSNLLPLLSLYMFLASLVNLFASYFIALRSQRLYIISIFSLAVTLLLFKLNNVSLNAIIIDFTLGSGVALTLLLWNLKRN